MPISELERKWWGMTFNMACEEMRRLKAKPNEEERLKLYGMYKQAIHGDIPTERYLKRPDPKKDDWGTKKYDAWAALKGQGQDKVKNDYLKFAEEMIKKYHRSIIRSEWNAEVWSVDY